MKNEVKTKSKYKVENWSEYNQQLKKRGSLDIFINENTLEKWQYDGRKVKGGNRFYSNLAIKVCLQFRHFFKLPLRQTQGFVDSLWDMMKVTVHTPNYTTLCRRTSALKIKLPRFNHDKNTTLIIDSTGLEIYEGGDWAERKRGYNRHKMWRKIHIVIGADNQIIQECALTPNSVDDAEMTKHLLKDVKKTSKKLIADRGYDKCKVYDFLDSKKIEPVINTQRNAVEHDRDGPAYKARNKAVRSSKDQTEKEKWKKETGYSKRAVVETAMYRYKRTFGEKLLSRKLENQQIEALLKCVILNKMLSLGKPLSKKVA